MPSATVTSTTAAAFIPEEWSNDTLDAVEFRTVCSKLVNRDYEGDIRTMGDTVHIPHVNNYTAKTKIEGINNPVEFEAITHGSTTLVIDTHIYAAFEVEDFAEKLAMPNFRDRQTKKLGYALARALDVAVTGLFDDVTTNIVGTYGVELTDNDYLQAWQLLAQAGAVANSEEEPVYTVLSPQAWAAALKIERFVNTDYGRDGDAISNAKIGRVYGSDVYISNLLVSPGANQHACAMFHRDAFALAVRQKPVIESDRLVWQLATAVVASQIFGKVVLTRPVETPGSSAVTDNFAVLLRTV